MIEQGAVFNHDFGPRQNHLQEGSRPVVVVQADALNKLSAYPNVIVVPLTTKQRAAATYVMIDPTQQNGLSAPSWAICNQIFTLDKGDLQSFRGVISKENLYSIKQALKVALGMSL